MKLLIIMTQIYNKILKLIAEKATIEDLKATKVEKGSAKPNKTKVANITMATVEEIAKTKMPDLNAASLEAATEMIKGTARSMGIVIED